MESKIQASPFNLDKWEFHICLSGLNFMVVVNLPITLNSQGLESFLFGMIYHGVMRISFLIKKTTDLSQQRESKTYLLE